MPSEALREWRTTRRKRLEELIGVHALIDPKRGPGRRAGTQQFNLAFIVVLAAEWQGFARALHDEARDSFAAVVEESGSRHGAERLRFLLTADRKLDRGNANQASIANDFRRLGILDLWDTVDATDPHGKSRRIKLELLMTARNAIAHADEAGLQALRAKGVPLNLAEAKIWMRALDGLAVSLDRLVAEFLGGLFGRGEPW